MTQPVLQGPWKEGRIAAASLCYSAPRGDQLEFIAANHAAVGIRGTLEFDSTEGLALFSERNWHLATSEVACDGLGAMPPSGVILPSPLNSRTAPPDASRIVAAIEETMPFGLWTIWRFPPAVLDEMGADGHARLLNWLGDHHARIWCAPVRDIAVWHAETTLNVHKQFVNSPEEQQPLEDNDS